MMRAPYWELHRPGGRPGKPKAAPVNGLVCGRKFCTSCGRWRHAVDFCRDPRTTSGLGSWCRTCQHRYRRRYLARPDKREALREYHRIYYEAKLHERRRAKQRLGRGKTIGPRQSKPLSAAPLVAAIDAAIGVAGVGATATRIGITERNLLRVRNADTVYVGTADRIASALDLTLAMLYD